MKTKTLLGLTVISLGALLAGSAKAGLDFRISIGLPLPAPRVVVAAPVACAPSVAMVSRPVIVPAPLVVVRPPILPHRPVLLLPPHHHRHGVLVRHGWPPHGRY